jgi:ribonuclease Z
MPSGALQGKNRLNLDFVTRLVATWPEEMPERPSATLPVTVRDIGPGLVIETESFKVTATETPHISSWEMKSLGYRVDSRYGSVAVSGDTAPSKNMVELARGADLLIHECVIPDYGMTRGGKFSSRSGVQRQEGETERPRTGHTSPSELGKLAQEAGVKKVVATHLPPYTSVEAAVAMSSLYYGPRQSPEIWEKWVAAIKAHYDGPVVLAEDALVLEVGQK